MKPTYYTTHEGGLWRKWKGGTVTKKELELARIRLQKALHVTGGACEAAVTLQSVSVHALAFGDALLQTGIFPRWDCLNGWTTGFIAAKIRNTIWRIRNVN